VIIGRRQRAVDDAVEEIGRGAMGLQGDVGVSAGLLGKAPNLGQAKSGAARARLGESSGKL
jgi:hypothetical protein